MKTQSELTKIKEAVDAFFDSVHEKMYGKEEKEGEFLGIEVGDTFESKFGECGFKVGEKISVFGFDGGNVLFSTGDDSVDPCSWDLEYFISQFSKVDKQQTKPAHYDSEIDPIAFAKANYTHSQVKGFMRINIIKYVHRYDQKDGVKDLKKARHYLDMLIELEEQAH